MDTEALYNLIKIAENPDIKYSPKGALVAAGIGAILGALSDNEKRWRGALQGGLTGAALGTVADYTRYGIEKNMPYQDTDSNGESVDSESDLGRRLDKARDKVRRFNETIQIPTKNEFAGKPGSDYNAERWAKYTPFIASLFGDRSYSKNKPDVARDAYTTSDDYIFGHDTPVLHVHDSNFGEDSGDLFSTLVHEYSHWQNKDLDLYNAGSGRSEAEKNKLVDAYGITDDDLPDLTDGSAIEEAGATNAELRAMIWDSLSARLGRDATYDEFKDYVGNMTIQQFFDDVVKDTSNAYLLSALDRTIINNDRFKEFADKNFVPDERPPLWHYLLPWNTQDMKTHRSNVEFNNNMLNREFEKFMKPIRRALLEVADNKKQRNTYEMKTASLSSLIDQNPTEKKAQLLPVTIGAGLVGALAGGVGQKLSDMDYKRRVKQSLLDSGYGEDSDEYKEYMDQAEKQLKGSVASSAAFSGLGSAALTGLLGLIRS